MDSNALERERGITILAKNTAITWGDFRINIVDTPGHADFGGEVERVLAMVDCVLLLVDAVDGPMPQTRFVTQKAFKHGLRPIVVINKIDRDEARPGWVLDQTFDLFDRLGATDEQLDFPVVYASALRGFAGLDSSVRDGDMQPLFQTIVDHCPPPDVDSDGPLQLQVTLLDYSSYVGAIGIGRIKRGTLKKGMAVTVVDREGRQRPERITQVLGFHGLTRVEVESACAGRYRRLRRHPGAEGVGHALRSGQCRAAAAADRGRADDQHDLRGQHLAVPRPRGQVRHQPPDPRAARPRVDPQRGAARGAHRRPGQVRGVRARRAASGRAAREHAPRGL